MALTKPPVLPAWAEAGDKVQPSNAEIQAGWPLSNVPPSRQRFNWLLNFLANGIRYLTRRGMPDYGADETYMIGDRVIGDDGKTYRSIQDNNTGNAPSASPLWWERWGFGASELSTELNKLDYKTSCRVATTANLAALSGLLTIDGVVLVAGDRVLVKDQAVGSQNGIYVAAVGAWARAADADDGAKLNSGAIVPVEVGTVNGDTLWMLTTDGAITIGVTSLAFSNIQGNVGTPGSYNSVTTDAKGRVVAGYNFARKNLLINGGFDIWQRGTNFAGITNAPVYTADRWFGYRNAVVAGMTVSQQAASGGGAFALRAQRDAGNASTACIGIGQVIESGVARRFAGKQLTISFSAKAGANFSAAGSQLPVIVYTGTGTNEGSVAMTAGTWTGNAGQNQLVTISTIQGRYSVTFSIPAGTKEIGFAFAPQTVGVAGANDWYEIEDVQVEVGSVATDFEVLPIQQTVAMCQRYYQIGATTFGDQSSSSGTRNIGIPFQTEMRVAPTAGTRIVIEADTNVNTLTVSNITVRDARVSIAPSAAGSVFVHAAWPFSAEI